jgi:hypothetical protein
MAAVTTLSDASNPSPLSLTVVMARGACVTNDARAAAPAPCDIRGAGSPRRWQEMPATYDLRMHDA